MNIRSLHIEEAEPLSNYQFAVNDDEEVMIAIPGYFKGQAHDAVLFYNGGEDALFVRNPHQLLICDAIHPDVRSRILSNEQILVYETDTQLEYMAGIKRADIDEFLSEAKILHSYHFPLHPFPVLDGTFDTVEAECDYCGYTHRINYRGKTEKGQQTVCPWCIQDMYPVRSDNTLFPNIDSEVEAEFDWCSVGGDTPPYFDQGRVAPLWGMHCNKFGVYLGQIEPEDLTKELRETLIGTWDNRFNRFKDDAPDKIFSDFVAGKLTAHLFRCVECKSVFCIFYERSTTPTMCLDRFVLELNRRYADSFTESWFRVETKSDGCTVITEMCEGRSYYTINIDPDGKIVHGERYDYVRSLMEKGIRIVPDDK